MCWTFILRYKNCIVEPPLCIYYKIYINYSDTFTMVVYDGYTCGIQFQNKFIVQVCLEHNGTQSFNKYEFAPPQTHITCSQQA